LVRLIKNDPSVTIKEFKPAVIKRGLSTDSVLLNNMRRSFVSETNKLRTLNFENVEMKIK